MKTYLIKEIFGATIQGEGTYAGSLVMFLRFSGCNKWSGLEKHKPSSICNFCDTDFRGGDRLTAQNIVDKLKKESNCETVVISGGEPTLQLDENILSKLKNSGFILHLETNGSVSLGHLGRYFSHITLSPKQSIENTKLERCDDLKILHPYIHKDITQEKFKDYNYKQGYLQAVWNSKYDDNMKDTINKLYEIETWKLSVQLHKIIGVE
jgi:organic radical activating enzyme